ncbi:enoyl-CoA hydratase/isomerase family protein [Brucella anthropi]|uniref:enoyl-CoA hydratase/isomerase family protein n=1 Tax=Brucella anthropi TaxID=529 RepID=UPI001CFE61F7|nr:enoyl-CoA hydratase/isomerase family protein [Brucella anthropi]
MIKFEKRGELGIFTIENGKVNPMTPQMHREFYLHLKALLNDNTLKVGILTGAGDRAFCAGDDIKSPRIEETPEQIADRHFSSSPEDGPYSYPGWEREVHQMRRLKPIIAATKGWCLGQGFFYLMRLTDIRVAGESSKFALPEIAYEMAGASGFTGITRHLRRADAMKLLMTGDPIDAQEALRIGLVNEVVPDTEVLDRAIFLGERIARHSARAIRVEMECFLMDERGDDHSSYQFADQLYRVQRLTAAEKAWEVDFQNKGVKG